MINEKSCASTSINWYPGHMAKTKKQIIEDLKLIDVVVEVLDARIPKSSINPDIGKYIKNKPKVIVLNKSDLSNEKENTRWINYYKENSVNAVLVDSNSGKGIDNVIREIQKVYSEDEQKYSNKGRKGKSIRVMVLGIPNVGKSSFINRITKKTSAEVGNKPGVTRQKQWIRVNENIELLDTPGVLWPKFEDQNVALNLSYTGTIKDDILDKVEIAYQLLKYLLENQINEVAQRYKISIQEIENELKNENRMENENIYEIMCMIGKKRGAIVSGGNVDDKKIANIILEDFRSGKLRKNNIRKSIKILTCRLEIYNMKEYEEIIKRKKSIKEVKLMKPLVWAYIGDNVYVLFIRMHLVNSTNLDPHRLHIESIKGGILWTL